MSVDTDSAVLNCVLFNPFNPFANIMCMTRSPKNVSKWLLFFFSLFCVYRLTHSVKEIPSNNFSNKESCTIKMCVTHYSATV